MSGTSVLTIAERRGLPWRRSLVMQGLGKSRLRWGVVLVVAALGVRAAPSRPAHADGVLSPIDRLVAEDDIRQRLALYTLYADGDGETPVDMAALANQLLTPDVVSKAFPANGGPPLVLVGRQPVADAAPRAIPDPKRAVAARHFLIQTYFDSVTPTTAKTRTTAILFRVSRNMVGFSCKQPGTDACGGKVLSSSIWTYHMNWRKTSAGWQISENIIRDDS